MRSSHNTSKRLTESLAAAGIDSKDLVAFIVYSLRHKPKHRTLKEAIHYKMMVIQVERLTLLIAA